MAKKQSTKKTTSSRRDARRSPCPISCSLEVFGDRWTLLVVRDLMLGQTRFKEFASSPEGIPTNILTERLARLQHHGIIRQQPVEESSKRFAYLLTEKGEALRPLMRSMCKWALEWEEGTAARLEPKR